MLCSVVIVQIGRLEQHEDQIAPQRILEWGVTRPPSDSNTITSKNNYTIDYNFRLMEHHVVAPLLLEKSDFVAYKELVLCPPQKQWVTQRTTFNMGNSRNDALPRQFAHWSNPVLFCLPVFFRNFWEKLLFTSIVLLCKKVFWRFFSQEDAVEQNKTWLDHSALASCQIMTHNFLKKCCIFSNPGQCATAQVVANQILQKNECCLRKMGYA